MYTFFVTLGVSLLCFFLIDYLLKKGQKTSLRKSEKRKEESISTMIKGWKEQFQTEVWRPFKKESRTFEFLFIQTLNVIHAMNYYFRCALQVGCWMLLFAYTKQALLVQFDDGTEMTSIFKVILNAFPIVIAAIIMLYFVFIVLSMGFQSDIWKGKYVKQIFRLCLIIFLAGYYKILVPETYALVTSTTVPLELFKPFIWVVVYIVISHFFMKFGEKTVSSAFDLVGFPENLTFVRSDIWKPFIKLQLVEYSGVLNERQTIRPTVDSCIVSLKYSPIKMSLCKRNVFLFMSPERPENFVENGQVLKVAEGSTFNPLLEMLYSEKTKQFKESFGMTFDDKIMKSPLTLYTYIKNGVEPTVLIKSSNYEIVADIDYRLSIRCITENEIIAEREYMVFVTDYLADLLHIQREINN